MAENTNKITIAEFKAWLEGITDLQGEDWTPNQDQWRKIKTKLFSLEGFDAPLEQHIARVIERAMPRVRMPMVPPPDYNWQQAQQVQPQQPQVGTVPPGSPAPLDLANVPPLHAVPGGSTLTNANSGTPPLTLPPGAKIGNVTDKTNAVKIEPAKTPDIDTSSGSYKSTFL